MAKYTYINALIQYGGPDGIRWISSSKVTRPVVGAAAGAVILTHPAAMIMEGVFVASMILQWWESRKTNLLQAAQYEERRITWLLDIWAQWCQELQLGRVRLDTTKYFLREVNNYIDKIIENDHVDIPSTLLLQFERTVVFLEKMNTSLSDILEVNNNIIKSAAAETNQFSKYRYIPSREIKTTDQREKYFSGICELIDNENDKVADKSIPSHLSEGFKTVTNRFVSLIELDKFRVENKSKKLADFRPLVHLLHELASAQVLLQRIAELKVAEQNVLLPSEDLLNKYNVHTLNDGSSRFYNRLLRMLGLEKN